MIFASCGRGDKLILPRNVHRSVINALILCGAVPVYINPRIDSRLGISLGMKMEDVESAVRKNPDAKAVLVNNPTLLRRVLEYPGHSPPGAPERDAASRG